MNALDQKINTHFPGLVVRKDLVQAVKGNSVVPSYVLEYLLGQYCATCDDATIHTGIETVREILRKHCIQRSEAGLVRSNIREKGRFKVIDRISAALNDRTDAYEAEFASLGIKHVVLDPSTVRAHPRLLVSGVWCIADIEYSFTEEKDGTPWSVASLKPIQLSQCSLDDWITTRRLFSTDEWIALLVQSMGLNPELFSRRSRLTQLVRLIPFCERNYNLMELGPKGTGKSHIYSEFSPHGILISGGEVTVPKLFVNNSTGRIGLVGYWDCVAFDEFAGQQKRVDKALVDIMKNYMANKSFSRGVETIGADASMVFVGNTQHTVPWMLQHADLFCDLPEKFHDSAFLDRIHFYIPGWEVDILRGEMFSSGYGFVVDYLAEILRSLRTLDLSDRYQQEFSLSPDLSTRDREGIHKTFSGLMKLLFPDGQSTREEQQELLQFAIEGRRRVKDQLLRIDPTYRQVRFYFQDRNGVQHQVDTQENLQYSTPAAALPADTERRALPVDSADKSTNPATRAPEPVPREQHLTFHDQQKGLCFDTLFGPWLAGATQITLTDPNIRTPHQLQNLIEFLDTILRNKSPGTQTAVHLNTTRSDTSPDQNTAFEQIRDAMQHSGLHFTWTYLHPTDITQPAITTNHGWHLTPTLGLDIFHPWPIHNPYHPANRLQTERAGRGFEVRYVHCRIQDT